MLSLIVPLNQQPYELDTIGIPILQVESLKPRRVEWFKYGDRVSLWHRPSLNHDTALSWGLRVLWECREAPASRGEPRATSLLTQALAPDPGPGPRGGGVGPETGRFGTSSTSHTTLWIYRQLRAQTRKSAKCLLPRQSWHFQSFNFK